MCSTKTPPYKQVLSFQELEQQTNSRSILKPVQRSGALTPKLDTPGSAVKAQISTLPSSSPLAQRIRQQILKCGDEISPASSLSTVRDQSDDNGATRTAPFVQSNNTVAERRKRFVQHRLVEARKSTPVNASSTPGDNATFFTPSPPTKTNSTKELAQKSHTLGSTGMSTSNASISSSRSTPPLIPFSSMATGQRSTNSQKSSFAARSTSSSAAKSSITKHTTPMARDRRSTAKATTHSGTKAAVTTPVLCVHNQPNYGIRSVPESLEKDDGPSTRRNLDKRTARLKYGDDFSNEIDRYRKMESCVYSPALTPENCGNYLDDSLNVYVRKRPIFSSQLENGDFDVVHVLGDAANADDTSAVVVYRATMGADMRTKMVQPVVFAKCLTAAFDHTVGSEQVYRTAVQPLVKAATQENKAATLLMFGQTGSGKTYTMTACQKLVAAEIFATLAVKQVQLQCIELIGKRCRDLMNETVDDVRIVDNVDGSVSFVNAFTSVVDSPRELLKVLAQSQKRRATQSTEQNDVSSRSHAIYQIKALWRDGRSGGILTLLDCAGTERRNDSLFHSKERQAESAEINSSLYALKECIRVRSRNAKANTSHPIRVPYRSSNLTRVLRESLECSDAQLVIIATVSPSAVSTEHTIQTLALLSNLTGTDWHEGKTQKLATPTMNNDGPSVPPKKWNHPELVAWLLEKRLSGKSPVPTQLDGSAVMRMSKIQLRHAFYDEVSCDDSSAAILKADLLFRRLRVETDRVARLDWKRRMVTAKLD